jgi:Na+/melibiose symporter-like transporter
MLAIVQWVLALTGYLPGEQQPGSALLAIRLMIGVVPAVLLGASIIVAWRSPLGKREHEALRRKLERRRTATPHGPARSTPGRP